MTAAVLEKAGSYARIAKGGAHDGRLDCTVGGHDVSVAADGTTMA